MALLAASGLLVSGCMGGPTYGTSQTANAQLTKDLSTMFSMKMKTGSSPNYQPRPELVKPASLVELPEPQESIASTNNPAWPESPEQKRARILAETTANQENNNADPLVINDVSIAKAEPTSGHKTPEQLQNDAAKPMSNRESKAKRETFNAALAEASISPTKRKYLSEPPIEYQVPAATAAVGDVGEDEADKARRIKKAATKKGGWRDYIPWL
jgi:hypothetical protein